MRFELYIHCLEDQLYFVNMPLVNAIRGFFVAVAFAPLWTAPSVLEGLLGVVLMIVIFKLTVEILFGFDEFMFQMLGDPRR